MLIQRESTLERVIENPHIFTDEEIDELFKVTTSTKECRQSHEELKMRKSIKDFLILGGDC